MIVNRTASPSRQKGMRLRTQVKRLPLVIALLVLLVTFWPCRSYAHLPRMQLAVGWGLLFIKRASGHRRGVHDRPKKILGSRGCFPFSHLEQCFLLVFS